MLHVHRRKFRPRERFTSGTGRNRSGTLLLVALLLLLGSGCTRRFFRHRADQEVDFLMCEKDQFPQWRLAQYHIYPDPRSRFADWTNWDRPPMPPDDPAAYKLSPRPQNPRHVGVAYIEGRGYLDLMDQWDQENRARLANATEERFAPESLPDPTGTGVEEDEAAQEARKISEQIERELTPSVATNRILTPEELGTPPPRAKPFLLNLEQTVQLGFMNSREFQTDREALYLSALPVTAERFSFAAQPYLTEQVIRQKLGSELTGTPKNGWIANSSLGFSKLFSTGALLLLNFANQTVYNLGKAPGTVSVSNLNFDIVQPFLAGGGRAVTLEPLTQAERNLLYAIRDYFFQRTEFFVFFGAGQQAFIPGVQAGVLAFEPTTVSQPGSFIPGATLPTGALGGAAYPAVQVPPGAGGRLLPGPTPAPTTQGYLGTVGERAVLVNYYKNIYAFDRFLERFQRYLEGGIVTSVQVGQIEQTRLRNFETLLGNHASYRISLDQLKQQLGLPMTIPIDLDDSPLQPMIRITHAYEQLAISSEKVITSMEQWERMGEALLLRTRIRRLATTTPLVRGTRLQSAFLPRWEAWQKMANGPVGTKGTLNDRVRQLQLARERLIRRQKELQGKPLPPEEQRRFDAITAELNMGLFEGYLRRYEAQPWKKEPTAFDQFEMHRRYFRAVLRRFLAVMEEAFDENSERIAASWPPLPSLCVNGVDVLKVDEDEALATIIQTALANRVDLMNVRAQVVDSWRKIKVAANALLGTFTVDYHVGTTSPAGQAKPLALGDGRTTQQLIFDASPPLVRIIQRNNYRSALIAYQQSRRYLMAYEDFIAFNVRLDLRNLRVAANNYQRIQKRQIQLAYRQVDQAIQAFSQPSAPPTSAAVSALTAGLVGPTAPPPAVGDPAALTQQLLNTQSFLLGAQNDLYNTWIGYLTTRMQFYRDLGLMQLDARGVWNDDAARSCDCNSPTTGAEQQRDNAEQLPEPRTLPATPSTPLEPQR